MYEQGMQITYDEKTGVVQVTYRGERVALPTTYREKDEAILAGEEYCRRRGWAS